jgi:hypothetical protein
MSKAIFDKVFSSAVTEYADFPFDTNPRWIAKKDDADIQLMAEATIQVKRLGQREVTAIIRDNKRAIFCVSGYERPDNIAAGLTKIDPTPGLFATFVTEANIPSTATASQARDILELDYKGVAGYNGHDLDRVLEVYPKLLFWEVDNPDTGQFMDDLFRISGSFVVRSYGQYPLEMSQTTKNKLIDVFENGPNLLPFPLILQGVLSYNWQSLFLDIYRSIEQLYSAPRLKKLSGKLQFGYSLSEVAEILESHLAWRPKEEEALSRLLQETSDAVRIALIEAIHDDPGPKPDATAEKCASVIYKLRNSHVHFRPAMQPKERADDRWDLIISAMCDALIEVYDSFGEDFLLNKSVSLAAVNA